MLNCYKHWVHLLLRCLGIPSYTLLNQEGVTNEYFLLMVLYSISLFTLDEELQDADPVLLSPFYEDDASSDS